jgi:hypothetical protein
MTLDELVERAVFLANSLDRSVHPDADVISAMASQLLAMKGALEGVRSFLASAPLESGYCCCGSPVEGHGFGDGHSPVDELQYAAHNQIDRIDALLPTSAADKIAEGLRDAIAFAKGGSPNSGGGDAADLS